MLWLIVIPMKVLIDVLIQGLDQQNMEVLLKKKLQKKLSAGQLIAERAKELGLSDETIANVKEVNSERDKAIEYCSRAGVKLGLGCDLHGNDN